jgi:hypothetical protein
MMISVSVSIYKNIIAQEKEAGGSLQSPDVLKQTYLKSMKTLVQLLRDRNEGRKLEVHTSTV